MNREDFPMLKKDLIYFDNGATTLKPKCVIDAMVDYYSNYSANAHRGDYDISLQVDTAYEQVREKVKNFIHCKSKNEIIFTKGATESLNMVVFGYMKYRLKKGDEVLLTKAEHASNVLPWQELEKEIGIQIRYIPLNEDHTLTLENVKKIITPKTKVISIAHITNVVGDIRPLEEIGQLCQENNILLVVDGAQSVAHLPMDVEKYHIDFLAFSAHKMLGPTGVGVLYGKYELLENMKPLQFGGGMNSFFESDGTLEYKGIPTRFEAGTPPIAEVIGLGAAIEYLQGIGMERIHQYEVELKKYAIQELEKIPNITIYNKHSTGGIVAFNIDDVFSQDAALYLNHYHICVRAGNHCAKILKDELKIKNTCRISFYLYNTKEEIDRLVQVLKQSKDIFKIVL